ncbi:hypothetical protein [Myceligenerans salitolerans]|uniref:Uncharacterized protein n=1 Tax=Myceligenerans salitolerans TaxID=1230528 RepID=A0ABS3IA09_9MICO|nr:hypothetical protein [Myceligenerans salitolerans]MBO0609866.1 hypothetical protein [Myceligenerans salitolerans]
MDVDALDAPGGRTRRGRGAVLLLAVVASGVLVWALFKYVITDPDLALEYLKALAWPAVVAASLFWLRSPLRDKLGQLLRAEGFGTAFQFGERTRQLEEGLGPAFLQLGATGDSPASDSSAAADPPESDADSGDASVADEYATSIEEEGSEAPSIGGVATDPEVPLSVEPLDDLAAIAQALGVPQSTVLPIQRRFDSEPEAARKRLLKTVIEAARRVHAADHRTSKQRSDTREGIEDVIRKSAAWGYDMGRAGARRAVPDVEWNEDGTWRIVTEVPRHRSQPQVSGDALTRQVRAWEDEIKELEREKYNPLVVSGVTHLGNQKWLSELKRKLARVDPTNPWVH